MLKDTAPPDARTDDLTALETFTARPLAGVLDDIAEHNQRFVYHPDESTHWLIALWVAHTHGLDRWDYSGRLYIHAPQPGVGKSEQAKVMHYLCPNGFQTVGVSAPGLFRAIADGRPTVFLDEADNVFSRYGGKDRDDVTAVINGGVEPNNFVARGARGGPVRYETYVAMALVGIDNGSLPETTRTRCIPIPMVPKPAGSPLEKFRSGRHSAFAEEIRWQLSNAAMDWEVVEPPLDNRQSDVWEALWSVAAAAGGEWPERARIASERHVWAYDVPEGKRLLASISEWFIQHPRESKVRTSVLANHVSSYDDLPTMASKGLAQRLKPYGIVSTKRSDKWYHRTQFERVWDMWL